MAHHEGRAVTHPRHGAVVDHEGQRVGQVADGLEREGIAAAGHDRDVHPASRRLVDRRQVLRGHAAVAVEQRAVDVDGEKADHPVMRLTNA